MDTVYTHTHTTNGISLYTKLVPIEGATPPNCLGRRPDK